MPELNSKLDDSFYPEIKKGFCEKCNTIFFSNYKRRIKNKICARCENWLDDDLIHGVKVRNWEN